MYISHEKDDNGTSLVGIVATIGLATSILSLPVSSQDSNKALNYQFINQSLLTIKDISSTNDNIISKTENNESPLIKFLGTWEGDDIDELLDLVYNSRSKF
jgi:hypothetical protein